MYLLFSLVGGPVAVPSPPFRVRCFYRGKEPGFLPSVPIGINALRSSEKVGFADAGPRSAPGERVPGASGKAGSCAGCFFRFVPLVVAVASGATSWLVPFVLSGTERFAQSGRALLRGVTLPFS